MTDKTFSALVEQTISDLPKEFREQLDNVEIIIDRDTANSSLFGLYHGVPKTKRSQYASLPDKIIIYKQVIESVADDESIIKQQIRKTVLHEIGHHFGLSDEEMLKVQ